MHDGVTRTGLRLVLCHAAALSMFPRTYLQYMRRVRTAHGSCFKRPINAVIFILLLLNDNEPTLGLFKHFFEQMFIKDNLYITCNVSETLCCFVHIIALIHDRLLFPHSTLTMNMVISMTTKKAS